MSMIQRTLSVLHFHCQQLGDKTLAGLRSQPKMDRALTLPPSVGEYRQHRTAQTRCAGAVAQGEGKTSLFSFQSLGGWGLHADF